MQEEKEVVNEEAKAAEQSEEAKTAPKVDFGNSTTKE